MGILCLCNPHTGIRIFRHSVYTYIMCSIICYMGHNPLCYNICYIAFFGYLTCYLRKNPDCCVICYIYQVI